jgi:thioredoxin 1
VVVVEVLTAAGCDQCLRAQALVQSVVEQFGEDQVRYRAVNVVDEIDYAVALRVLGTPAVAIDGSLAFGKLPSPAKLRAEIEARLQTSDHNDSQGVP